MQQNVGFNQKRKRTVEICIVLLVFSVAVSYALNNQIYSAVDERGHFSYLDFIAQNNMLPSFFARMNPPFLETPSAMNSLPQYEATQPPVYYVFASLFAKLIVDLKSRIIFVRILGGLFLAFSAGWTMRLLNNSRSEKYSDNTSLGLAMDVSIVLLFFLSPGIVVRSTTVSNEPLLVFLTTIFLGYLYEKSSSKFSENNNQYFDAVFMSLLCTVCILTKLTAIYLLPLGCVVLFMVYIRRPSTSVKITLFFVILTSMLVFPWFIYNLIEYRNITSTSFHIAFVLPINNPENIDYGFVHVLSWVDQMVQTFWFPQEWSPTALSRFSILAIYLLSTIVLVFSLLLLGRWGKELIQRRSFLTFSSSDGFPFVILITSIVLNIFSLVSGTISTNINLMLGRYLYMNILAFVMIYQRGGQMITKYKTIAIIVNISTIILLHIEYLRGKWG